MWKLTASGRIAHWKDFRKSLDDLSLEQAVQSVAEYWQKCPYVPYYLDPGKPETWPTPWELIAENYYCDLAKSLGMLYTIHFTSHGVDLDAELRIYVDAETGFTYNLPILAQGKYVVNLIDNVVVNIESINKNFKLTHQFNSAELKLKEY